MPLKKLCFLRKYSKHFLETFYIFAREISLKKFLKLT